jgi:pimeloyl-ACP methyl ester carboxylesterase
MIHGDRVAYRDEGAGEVLLLIHGMSGSSQTWRDVIPILAKKYRVIAPDLFGAWSVRQATRRLLGGRLRGPRA